MFSDAYTTEDIVFHWRDDAKAVEVNDAISLPEYHLKKNVTAIVCSQNINSTGICVVFVLSVHQGTTL